MRSRNNLLGIKNIIEAWNIRKEMKKDFVIAITGKRGLGKSTLAYKLAKFKGNFKPKRDIIYDLETFKKAISGWHRTLIVDEMIYVAYKRNWQKSNQIELAQQLTANRDHQHFILLCVPNFWDLDKPVRDMCHLRIDVFHRSRDFAKGAVHTQMQSHYAQDYWDSSNNEKTEKKYVTGKLRPKFHKLSTFVGYLKFTKLKEKEEKLYQNVKNEKRYNLYEKEEKKEDGLVQLTAKTKINIYDQLALKIKDEEFTPEMFDLAANIHNIPRHKIVSEVGRRLRDKGLPPLSGYLRRNKDIGLTKNLKNDKSETISLISS